MGDNAISRVEAWVTQKFRTRFDKEWQLAKVELRLGCVDSGGDWRDNLLDQQTVLRPLRDRALALRAEPIFVVSALRASIDLCGG